MLNPLQLFRRHPGRHSFGIPGTLTGFYVIRGETLEGWVNHDPTMRALETKVRAMRSNEVLAECSASGERKSNRLLFSLPLVGFSVRDLGVEAVILTACNAVGDTGVLSLDGPTRIELIRDHLGAPLDPVFDIDFSLAGKGHSYLGQGWAKAETYFTWTTDDDSFIVLSAPLNTASYLLRIKYGTFIAPFLRTQSMEISIDGQLIASFSEDEQVARFREFRIDWAPAGATTPPTIRFHHPDAARPRDHFESTDGRRLAFSFQRVSLGREL